MKNPVLGVGQISPQALGQGAQKPLQSNTPCRHCSPLPTRTLWQDPITEDTTHFGQRTWKHQVGTDWELASFWPAFIMAEALSGLQWQRRNIDSLTQHWTLSTTVMTCATRERLGVTMAWRIFILTRKHSLKHCLFSSTSSFSHKSKARCTLVFTDCVSK